MIPILKKLLTLSALLVCGVSFAQQFPTRHVTLVVPFSAGGPTDTLARPIAQLMSKKLGQTVVVENVAGAAGSIGATKVAKAAPDGYTLLLGHTGVMAANVGIYKNLAYHPVTDFEPVAYVASNPFLLLTKKDLPVKTVGDFLNYAKATQDKMFFGTAGSGSGSHITAVLFQSMLKTNIQYVTYKGTGPAMTDLIAGNYEALFDQTVTSIPQAKGGTVRALAVTSKTRVSAMPDLPSLDEAGLKGFESILWNGIFAPKGTPKPVIDQLFAAVSEALKDPRFRKQMAEVGVEVIPPEKATPELLRALVKAEVEKWVPILKAAGVTAD